MKESNIEYAVDETESEPAGFETDQIVSGCYNGSFLSTSEFPDLGDIPDFDEIPDPNLVTDFGENQDFDTDQESDLNQVLCTSVHPTATKFSDQDLPLKKITSCIVPVIEIKSLSRSPTDSYPNVVPLNNNSDMSLQTKAIETKVDMSTLSTNIVTIKVNNDQYMSANQCNGPTGNYSEVVLPNNNGDTNISTGADVGSSSRSSNISTNEVYYDQSTSSNQVNGDKVVTCTSPEPMNRAFYCKKCKAKFSRYQTALYHCVEFKWKCDKCGISIKTKNNVNRHLKRCEARMQKETERLEVEISQEIQSTLLLQGFKE